MHPAPVLSIITINLNNGLGLRKTLKSIESQTWQKFESIIIDGGSTDNSVAVIREFAGRDRSPIRKWVSEKDHGLYHAQNKGIREASGRYLLFLNSGDFLYKKQALHNLKPDEWATDLIYGNIIFQHKYHRVRSRMPEDITAAHMFYSTLMHPATFIKRELFDIIGLYREDFRICSDYYFFTKAILSYNVSRTYKKNAVTVYAMDGVSSNPKNFALQDAERRTTQLEFFSKEMLIEIAKKGSPLDETFYTAFTAVPKYFVRKFKYLWGQIRQSR